MMNLYTKNLTSLAALRREKKRLQGEADTNVSSIFNTGQPRHTADNEDQGGFDMSTAISAGMDALTSKGAMSKIMALALPMLEMAELKIEKKFIMSVSKELIGGYLKWKAVKIGYNMVSSILKSQYEKRKD